MNAIVTPNGRYLGRKPDKPDSRDHRFAAVHAALLDKPLPPKVDLRERLPPAFDQGKLGSCGPNAGSGLMSFLFPDVKAFARLQIYYDVRSMEGDVGEDGGVDTRDVLKTLTNTGAAPETYWPYDISRFTEKPNGIVYVEAGDYKLQSYSRLVTARDYLACLADGFPFLLGFNCFESIDSDQLARTGVMPWPVPSKEKKLGGHDVLAVGYDMYFKGSDVFRRSGVDPVLVSDHALLIRNSWGSDWGIEGGHFWMPLGYASDASTGNDAWTGRK